KAGVLPSEKGEYIKNITQQNEIVAMAGDGINDAEALALADVSFAMSQGTDIAMDVAGITLMHGKITDVPLAIKLSKLTSRAINQNLFWAFFYNVVCIPIAAGVLFPINGFLLSPMLAGAAMAFSSVSVVLNSLRLRNASL
ncbi:MAG: HAD-IC family P-type ATPase, partial [Bacteroidia bacterium]